MNLTAKEAYGMRMLHNIGGNCFRQCIIIQKLPVRGRKEGG